MDTLSVRKVDASDLQGVDILFDEYRSLYGCPTDIDAASEFLRMRLASEESVVLVASAAGEAIGFAQLFPSYSSVAMAKTYVLNDLYVRRENRRKGVGKRLMAAVRDFAESAGAKGLTLSTEASNVIAHKLYQSAGWERHEQFHVYHLAVRE